MMWEGKIRNFIKFKEVNKKIKRNNKKDKIVNFFKVEGHFSASFTVGLLQLYILDRYYYDLEF